MKTITEEIRTQRNMAMYQAREVAKQINNLKMIAPEQVGDAVTSIIEYLQTNFKDYLKQNENENITRTNRGHTVHQDV